MSKGTSKNSKSGIEVRKKEGESAGSLSRRFVQKVRSSGVLVEARGRQVYKKPLKKAARKKSALVRAERKKDYDKLRKWGKLK
ncbi:MAG: 30S ribosomal protein S21 [Candidatus Spechtbacteria bacterium]|nr:30S ribosomal protein S21 [Candidatus Spechtbacteria bacterium]